MPKTCLPRILPATLSLLLTILPGARLPAQDTSVRPGINKPYENANVTDTVKRFEGESREIYQNRQKIVDALGLRPGLAVADVGAGTGLFTRLIAPKVAPAKVYAVDISQKFIDHVLETCREAKIQNVEGIVGSDVSPKLPAASVDLVLICDTYHHFEFPFKMLSAIHEALRPGGRLVLIDYQREEGVSEEWVLKHVRAGRKTVIEEVSRSGFKLCDEPQLMKGQYVLRFVRENAAENNGKKPKTAK